MRFGKSVVILVVASLPLAAVRPAAQQAASGIAGVVRDTSGAILPGVMVEATSPALIEKVRAATTDGQGQYRISDLLPGTYSVVFTLPGFASIRREGIQLTTAFVATVNVELSVGSVAETITVAGSAPTVDVHNVVHGMAYRAVHDGPFLLQPEEIVRGEFVRLAEVERRSTREPFCPDSLAVVADYRRRTGR